MLGFNFFNRPGRTESHRSPEPKLKAVVNRSPSDEANLRSNSILSRFNKEKKQLETDLLNSLEFINNHLKRGGDPKYPKYTLENILDAYLLSNERRNEMSPFEVNFQALATKFTQEDSEFVKQAETKANSRRGFLETRDYDVMVNRIKSSLPKEISPGVFFSDLVLWGISNENYR